MIKNIILFSLVLFIPTLGHAQVGVGLGAFTNSFNNSYLLQSQGTAALAQAALKAAEIRQIRIQLREKYGTNEIKILEQQEALADKNLQMYISTFYSSKNNN